MDNKIKEEIMAEKTKTEYRNGNLLQRCDACGREIQLYEKIYNYGGKICKDCYEDVGRHLI